MTDAQTAANGAPLICTSAPLTAADIFGRPLMPAPRPSSQAVLALAIEVLPTIADGARRQGLLPKNRKVDAAHARRQKRGAPDRDPMTAESHDEAAVSAGSLGRC